MATPTSSPLSLIEGAAPSAVRGDEEQEGAAPSAVRGDEEGAGAGLSPDTAKNPAEDASSNAIAGGNPVISADPAPVLDLGTQDDSTLTPAVELAAAATSTTTMVEGSNSVLGGEQTTPLGSEDAPTTMVPPTSTMADIVRQEQQKTAPSGVIVTQAPAMSVSFDASSQQQNQNAFQDYTSSGDHVPPTAEQPPLSSQIGDIRKDMEALHAKLLEQVSLGGVRGTLPEVVSSQGEAASTLAGGTSAVGNFYPLPTTNEMKMNIVRSTTTAPGTAENDIATLLPTPNSAAFSTTAVSSNYLFENYDGTGRTRDPPRPRHSFYLLPDERPLPGGSGGTQKSGQGSVQAAQAKAYREREIRAAVKTLLRLR
ncbi:unnamed protein product [Amoebophrya sp. A120]|nr:unnamed protein product [Amoebophrya sp. A120]|eukprot:GSA120T00021261001.1